MKLEEGKKYDISTLSFSHWDYPGDLDGSRLCDCYNCWDYFQDGEYLGPDEFGVEPVFHPLD